MLFRIKENTRIDFALAFTLFLPIFWEQLASVLLSVISSAISSNIDPTFLNATSLVGSVVGPLTNIYAAIATGTAILMSQYFGANDDLQARKLFSTSNTLGLSIAFSISIIIILFRSPILDFLYPNMSEFFLVNAKTYAIFLSITIPMSFFRTNIIGILRGALNTKGPLYISLFGGVIDILLRFFFMVVLKMGIVGLGLASVISNVFFTTLTLIILHKVGTFNGMITHLFRSFDKTVAKDIVKMSWVICLQTFAVSWAALFLNQIFARVGDLEMSAYTITVSAETLIILVPLAVALVAQILAGKYKGAGEIAHAMKISVSLTIAATVLHVIIALISFPIAGNVLRLYTDNEAILRVATKAFRLNLLVSTLFWSSANVLSAGIRGMGNVKYPAMVLIITSWVYMLPATWYFCVVLK